jgi:hypothetical protein
MPRESGGRVPPPKWKNAARMHTHINGNMAHDGCMVWQSDVLGVVFVVIAAGCRRLVDNNEGALDIYPHGTRSQYCVLNV